MTAISYNELVRHNSKFLADNARLTKANEALAHRNAMLENRLRAQDDNEQVLRDLLKLERKASDAQTRLIADLRNMLNKA